MSESQKVKSKTIGENVYEVTLFSTSPAIRHLRRLIKVIGPSMAALFEGSPELSLDETGPLTKAIMLLSDNIDKEDVVSLIKDLIAQTRLNGQTINFELDFQGNIQELFKVVAFVIEANYGNFSQLAASN